MVIPYKYKTYTTEPSRERLSKQIVHGVNPVTKNTIIEGFQKTNGNQRFDLQNLKWKKVTNNSYVKNEINMRPTEPQKIPNTLNVQETLYGFKPRRDGWVPKPLLQRSAAIPFIGLKN